MDIFLLRTAHRETLAKYFSDDEVKALGFYALGMNRSTTMFDFAARCYSGEAPNIRHPLGYHDARCTHSNSLNNTYNTLHFSSKEGEEFVVVQRVTFMDALIFPSRGVTLIIRSIKEEQVAGVVTALERLRIKDPIPRAFGGFIVSHHRPYHYLYESLPAMLWFDRKVRPKGARRPRVELVQHQGGDYMPLSTLFPHMATYTASSSALNWTSKVAGTFYVKMGYSGMWDKDEAQVAAIGLLDAELREMFLAEGASADQTFKRQFGVLFDVSDAKGTWETIAEDIPTIVGQLMERLGTGVNVYLDGWTLSATPSKKELKRAKEEATFASSIAKSLPQGAESRSIVGASPYLKMQFMDRVDVAVCRYSTGSLVPSRIMHKPGIVHHSGKAGIFRKLHFHGPGVQEMLGDSIGADEGIRDQDISYSLDAGRIAKILGDILTSRSDLSHTP